MNFSIENEMFIPGPSLAAEKQGLRLKFSIENEHFKARLKISSENDNFVRGRMVFSCVRARMIFFDPRALWDVKARSLQRGFWPRNSQLLIWILLWIFGIFAACFFQGKGPEKIHQKSPAKFTQDFGQKNSPRISAEALSWQNVILVFRVVRNKCTVKQRIIGHFFQCYFQFSSDLNLWRLSPKNNLKRFLGRFFFSSFWTSMPAILHLIPEFIFLSLVMCKAGFPVFSVFSAFSGFQWSRSGIVVFPFFRFFRLFRFSGVQIRNSGFSLFLPLWGSKPGIPVFRLRTRLVRPRFSPTVSSNSKELITQRFPPKTFWTISALPQNARSWLLNKGQHQTNFKGNYPGHPTRQKTTPRQK